MSLLFDMLSTRSVIGFLSRSNRLLFSSLQSPSAVILETKKIKFLTVSKDTKGKESSNYHTISLISHANMEKALAPHSSTLPWRIPWRAETGRLQSMGFLRVGHGCATSLIFHFHALEKNGNPL